MLGSLGCLLSSCNSGFREPIDFSEDLAYFPLEIGTERIYEVEEQIYEQVSGQTVLTTLNYELREEISDTYPGPEGTEIFLIPRAIRNDSNEDWNNIETWSVRMEEGRVIVNEGSNSFLKLSFPARVGRTWDGNALNDKMPDSYEIISLAESYQVPDGEQFPDCLVVLQNDNQDFIVMLDKRLEVYSRNLGMVYKESTILEYCTAPNCLGQQQIRQGRIIKMKLKS